VLAAISGADCGNNAQRAARKASDSARVSRFPTSGSAVSRHASAAAADGGAIGGCVELPQCGDRAELQEPIEMTTFPMPLPEAEHYELRYPSLFNEGRGFSFPCDAAGHVNMDALSEQARHNYFYVRTVVGREFATPAVRPHSLQ
jgi:hypothetical protein